MGKWFGLFPEKPVDTVEQIARDAGMLLQNLRRVAY
jgi:hypothetical protein